MSTYNHTAFSTSALIPATGANLNAPLATLDAAIGDLTTLTTTPKTSVAGALGTTAIPTTAKTVSGAIAELHALVATAAPVNIVWDPFNAEVPVASAGWGGIPRWWHGIDWGLKVDPDAANPYDAPTLQLIYAADATGEWIGKIMKTSEIGCATGDVVSFKTEVFGTNGEKCYMTCQFHDGAAMTGAAATGAEVTMDGATIQRPTVTSIACPSAAKQVWVWLRRSIGGTNAINIYSWWGTVGAAISTRPVPTLVPSNYIEELRLARGSMPSLDARLDISLNADGTLAGYSSFPVVQDVFGRHYLRQWQGKMGGLTNPTPVGQASIVMLTDSWGGFIESALKPTIQTAYGKGGVGWVGFGNAMRPLGVVTTFDGLWSYSDQLATSRGLDITHVLSSDIATPGKMTLTLTYATTPNIATTSMVIYYMKQVGGGTFRYNVNGGGWTTIDTADAAEAAAFETIAGLDPVTSHVLEIEITVAGAAGVKLCGVVLKAATVGVVIHKSANNGSTAADWTEVDSTMWSAQLAQLAPDLCMICLGVNDCGTSVVTFEANLNILVDRIQAALPLSDILILTPGARQDVGGLGIGIYVTACRNVAVAQGCACLDLYLNTDTYTNANARGLMADTAHLATAGWYLVRNLIMRLLQSY